MPSISPVVYKNFRISFFPNLDTIRHIFTVAKPDILHIQSHFFICRAALKVAQERHVPAMGTNHFMPENLTHYFHFPPKLDAAFKNWGWQDFKKVFEQLAIVTTPTQTAANLLKGINFSRPVYPLSCGINRQKFHPGYDASYLTTRYHLPPKPILLYVGRLDKEKNLPDILQALALVPIKNRPHFVIAGRGAEEAALHALTKELNLTPDITFTGFVPDEDLPALYCLADCFIMGGTAELQSLVTMEAMASGLPILAANAIALPELVHDGLNGYLFEAGDRQQLATLITTIMIDTTKRQAMGQQSLQIIAKHDSEAVLKTYEAKFQEAISLNKATATTKN